MSKIYLASSWKMASVVKDIADLLRKRGHEVDAFCDDENGKRVSFDWNELFDIMKDESIDISIEDAKTMMTHWRVKEAFKEDKKFIDWADVLIMLMPCGRSSHLEAGYAAGSGKRLYIIGGFEKGEFETMYGFADKMYYYEETHKMFNDLKKCGDDKWISQNL